MRIRSLTLTTLVVTSLSIVASSMAARAHQIWIQQNSAGEFHIYYGEFGENLRETSPGLLDRIDAAARELHAGFEQSLETKRGATNFALPTKAGYRDIIVENSTPIFAEARVGERTYQVAYHSSGRYAADLQQRPPKLTLDVVPSNTSGKFIAYFRNNPLKKAKVSVVSESGWMKETRTNEAGEFEASFPWKTAYVIEVTHIDRAGGEHAGRKFDASSFSTTLSIATAQGLEPLPKPPAGIPEK